MGAAHAGTVTVCICIIHSTSAGLLIGLVGGSQKPPVKESHSHNYHRRHNNVGIEIISFMRVQDSLTFPNKKNKEDLAKLLVQKEMLKTHWMSFD